MSFYDHDANNYVGVNMSYASNNSHHNYPEHRPTSALYTVAPPPSSLHMLLEASIEAKPSPPVSHMGALPEADKCRNRECSNPRGQPGKPRSIYCSSRCQSREQNLRQGRIKNVRRRFKKTADDEPRQHQFPVASARQPNAPPPMGYMQQERDTPPQYNAEGRDMLFSRSFSPPLGLPAGRRFMKLNTPVLRSYSEPEPEPTYEPAGPFDRFDRGTSRTASPPPVLPPLNLPEEDDTMGMDVEAEDGDAPPRFLLPSIEYGMLSRSRSDPFK